MTVDRAALGRYLRQLRELGIDEIAFDGLSGAEAIALLARLPTPAAAAAPAAPPRSARSVVREAAPAREHVLDAGTAQVTVTRADQHAGAGALQLLEQQAGACALCGLHTTRSTVVFGEGDPTADVVVVGEAPGQEEDRTGRPFVGRAGRLLDLLLMTAGFPREKVYICNVLKCRPPKNRNPEAAEVSACTTTFLHGQLEAISPRVVLAVGKFAAQALLQSDESIGRLRGVKHMYRDRPLIVTYHPAYLLRSPQMTRVAWQDFQLVRRVLNEQA